MYKFVHLSFILVWALAGCAEEAITSPDGGGPDSGAADGRADQQAPLLDVRTPEADHLAIPDVGSSRDGGVADSQPVDQGPPADMASKDSAPPPDLLAPDAGPCVHPPVTEDCADGWCRIVAGCFWIGSPGGEKCRSTYEDPARVTLTRDFEIQRTETTQGEFAALMGYQPSKFTACGTDCPVDSVNWHEAAAYCNALSKDKGLAACYDCTGTGDQVCCNTKPKHTGSKIYDCTGYRLPSEAEWEYAYRAGTTTALYIGPITDCKTADPNATKIGWYAGNSAVSYAGCFDLSTWGGAACAGPHPVGLTDPNPRIPNGWGLYDMAGNVTEWCNDRSQGGGYHVGGVDPGGPLTGYDRILRGGSWYAGSGYASQLRAASRPHYPAGHGFQEFGFRCARTLPP